jgi:hypothetical protein
MKAYSLLSMLLIGVITAGCANSAREQSAVAKNDAVEDYITAAEMPTVDSMRTSDRLHYKKITDRYIILYDRNNPHLVAFTRRCRELNESDVTPDIRHDSNNLRARFDTFRGCPIGKLYELNEGQAKELLDLGEDATQ